MANTIKGKVFKIGQVESVPYGDHVFTKRELVLDASRYDPYTGERFDNFPKFEFTQKNVSKLDELQVGQLVTVTFALRGRWNQERNTSWTDIIGYQVETAQQLYKEEPQQQFTNGGQQTPPQAPNAALSQPNATTQYQPQSPAATSQDNLPF